MSDYLLRHRTLNPSPRDDKPLAALIRRILERKFDAILKLLFAEREIEHSARTRLRKRLMDASSLGAGESQSAGRNQVFQNHAAPVKTCRAGAQTGVVTERHAISLVKAPVASPYSLSMAPSSRMHEASSGSGCQRLSGLCGLCILCVGGRAALYPAYRRLVEGSGGCFLIYRGDRDAGNGLPALLLHADAVICPVDCVNHGSFFYVKQHCMRFNKPCALLERSSLPAFRKGIEMLAAANFQI